MILLDFGIVHVCGLPFAQFEETGSDDETSNSGEDIIVMGGAHHM